MSEPSLDSFKRVKLYTVDELSKSVGLNLNETTASDIPFCNYGIK